MTSAPFLNLFLKEKKGENGVWLLCTATVWRFHSKLASLARRTGLSTDSTGGAGLLQEGGGGLLMPLGRPLTPAAIANLWFQADVFNEDVGSGSEDSLGTAGDRLRSRPASRGAAPPGPPDEADSMDGSLQPREEGPAVGRVKAEAKRGVQPASRSAPGPSGGAGANALPVEGECATWRECPTLPYKVLYSP